MSKRTATSPQPSATNRPKTGAKIGKVPGNAKSKSEKKDAARSRSQASAKSGANQMNPRPSKRDAPTRNALKSPTHIEDDVIAGGEDDQRAESSTTTRKDPSDRARDQRLGSDMEQDGVGRSAQDRHRERLTAVEAKEDGVSEDEDETDEDKNVRDQLLAEKNDEETEVDQKQKKRS